MKCICCGSTLILHNSKKWAGCMFPDCPYYYLPVNPSLIKDTVKSIGRVKISKTDIKNWTSKWGKND